MNRVLIAAVAVMLIAPLRSSWGWQESDDGEERSRKPSPKQLFEPPVGLPRIAKDQKVWIDLEKKAVVADGVICLREGQLEMFACPKGTKEHEAVVSLDAKAKFVHAGLLRLGLKPGSPVKFAPEYEAATGPEVEIYVAWKDETGKENKIKAQEWIKHAKTKEIMKHDWIFAGSGFWTDESTGDEHYFADNGDMVCVSNFTTAMLDLPIKSSTDAADLLYICNTEKIPKLGTPVRMYFQPKAVAKVEGKAEPKKAAK
jgi:hypothetical protein